MMDNNDTTLLAEQNRQVLEENDLLKNNSYLQQFWDSSIDEKNFLASKLSQPISDSDLTSLMNGITYLEQQIAQIVNDHEQGLVAQTIAVHGQELENELARVRSQVLEIQQSVVRLQNRYMINESSSGSMIHGRIIQLRNMYHAAEMLRFVDRVLKILIKIQRAISSDPESQLNHHTLLKQLRDIDITAGNDVPLSVANIALHLFELEQILQHSEHQQYYKKTGIDVIDEQLDSLKIIKKAVLEFSLQVLEVGMSTANLSQIASSCQVFFNLQILDQIIHDRIMKKKIDTFRKDAFITNLFSTNQMKQQQGKILVANLRRLLFDEYRNSVKEMFTLESVLRKKKCAYTSTLFASVVMNEENTSITETYWRQLSQLITNELVNVTSVYTVRSLFLQEYRQINSFFTEFCQTVSGYLQPNSFDFAKFIRACLGGLQ